MRRTHFTALSTASLATIAMFAATPASAQTPTDQAEADACANLPTQQEREACLLRAGDDQASLPEGGAPASDAIVVTGSRIARPNFDTLQPSVIIDSEQIENRGFETLGQAINEQPSFGVPGASPVGAGQAGSFGSGQSFVNFLGLGSQRTLTLVNGRRFVTSNTASIFGPTSAGTQVDLNAINTRLVERVETIAIGGAPIYGSDAIAGTVNVILRRDFDGIELDAQYGIAEAGDAPNYRLRAIAGHNFGDGRGNVVVSGEYNRGRGLVYNDREVTRRGRFYGTCAPGSAFTNCLYENRRIPSISETGILTVGGDVFGLNFPLSPEQAEFLVFGDPTATFGVTDAQGRQLQFDVNGNFIPIEFGQETGSAEAGDFNIDFSGGNGFNITNTAQLLTDTERYNANILFNFELTDNVRVFAEGWYAHSSAVNLREQPVYNSGLFDSAGTPDGPIIIDINNPFLTAAQRAVIQSSITNNPFSDQNILGINQDYFYLSRANTDITSGRASSETDIYRIVGGFEGSLGLMGREFNWELSGNYGRARSEGREPALIQQNFERAVDARLVNGQIVCGPGTSAAIPSINPNCAPINLFGQGRISQEGLDYITAIADPSSLNEQIVFNSSIAGPIANLPGGNLSIALGFEHRDESSSFDPGAFYFGADDPNPAVDSNGDGDPTNDRQQYGRSIPILPVSGSYNTDEVFGEITAEIFGPQNDTPFFYRLELHGAARYVDHSTAGGDWTYTVEGRWAPIRDIAFRANYTRAIRSPAITEVFNPSSTFFGFATDPCDRNNRTSGPNPTARQANCTAAGIPANFTSLSNQRSFLQASQGNVELENEKSEAWSVGAVLTPRFIPNLRISADWLDIRLANAISSFSGSQVVASCYDATDFPTNEFCSRLDRDAQNQLSFIQTSYFNANELRYRGLLGALDYRRETPFLGADSRIGINLSYQYLDTLTSQASTASTPGQTHGTLGYPRHSAVLNLNYEHGPALVFASLNYTGKVVQEAQVPDDFREFNNLDDVLFVNAGLAFNVNERMRFRFTVDNLLGSEAPFPVPAFGGVVTYFPGILGRYYRVGASVRF
jgi:outer membrane receptor protein involved in Fe transport